MLIELISPSNYVSYNIKLAELLGLHSAIYVSELMNINDKAIRKDKVNESRFSLDREYIRRRTTISVEEQLELDKNLIKLGIVEKSTDDDNCITFNISVLTTLMMSTDDDDLISSVKKLVKLKEKPRNKQTKAEAIRQNLKSNIMTTNVELLTAYSEWIDAVFAKDRWMSKTAVLVGQQVVDDFANRDLDVALNLISIATLHGYRDMNWAVSKYKEQYRFRREVQPPVISNPQKVGLSNEVF
jgi:hypothetical protein